MPTLKLNKIIFRNNDTYLKMYQGSDLIAEVDSQPEARNYLTFTALEANSTVRWTNRNSTVESAEYSLDDGNTWTTASTSDITLTNVGDKVMFRGVNTRSNSTSSTSSAFNFTGQIKISGNLLSMINKDPDETSFHGTTYTFSYYFSGKTTIKDISELIIPQTAVPDYAFRYLFNGCTGITSSLPKLEFDHLYTQALAYMFRGCTGLTGTVRIKCDEVNSNSLTYMFQNCTGITGAEITGLENDGIFMNNTTNFGARMFYGCTNLNYIKALVFKTSTTLSITNWAYDVAATGTFVKLTGQDWATGVNGIPEGWTVEEYTPTLPEINGYVTLENIGIVDSTISVSDFSNFENRQFYSTDTINWSPLTTTPVTIIPGESLYLCGKGHPGDTEDVINKLSITGSRIKISGNAKYLYSCDDIEGSFIPEYGLARKFSNCTGLRDASELVIPNVRIEPYCCHSMFSGCTSLFYPPSILPSTTLESYCYYSMFASCTNLYTIPTLPATTDADHGYSYMFQGCIGITNAEINLTNITNKSCLERMFDGCTNLRQIRIHATSWNSGGTPYWLQNVSVNGEFYNLGGAGSTYSDRKYLPVNYIYDLYSLNYSIPKGWKLYNNLENISNYITLTSKENGSTLGLASLSISHVIYYSLGNSGTWDYLTPSTPTITLNYGDTIKLAGTLTGAQSSTNYTQFTITGNVEFDQNDSNGLRFLWDYYLRDSNQVSTNNNVSINSGYHLRYGIGYNLFKGCTGLKNLPAVIHPLSNQGVGGDYFNNYEDTVREYYGMFEGCTGITSIPSGFFNDNSSYIETAYLYTEAYKNMFKGCTGLTSVPTDILPVKTLYYDTYASMFEGCTGIIEAPELPAKTVPAGSYNYMFKGCTSLNKITINAENWDSSSTLGTGTAVGWVDGVAATGDFYNNGLATISTGINGIPSGWTEHKDVVPQGQSFTLTCRENGSTLGLASLSTNHIIYYKTSGDWNILTTSDTVTVNSGDTIELAGTLTADQSTTNYTKFTMTGKFEFDQSDPNGVLYIWNCNQPTEALKNFCGYRLFDSCSALINVPLLPSTTLATSCYQSMFSTCTGITSLPSGMLPATTLTDKCYSNMFYYCTGLTTISSNLFSAITITTGSQSCYRMFQGCSSIVNIPSTLFNNFTTFGDQSCQQMFESCSSIVEAPVIPAAVLSSRAFNQLFRYCSSLNKVVSYLTGYTGTSYMSAWLNGVAATGDFYNLGGASFPSGNSGIPSGWTTHTSL